MAYISTAKVAEMRKKLGEVCKRYGMKATIRKENNISVHVIIRSGTIDFIKDWTGFNEWTSYGEGSCVINEYWYHTNFAPGSKSVEFIREIVTIINDGNHDNSDIMTDYFDVGWYTHISLGEWKKPYQVVN